MSNKPTLTDPLDGYRIKVTRYDGTVANLELKVNQVGGAHITNPEALVVMIEDAVFNHEKARQS